MKFQPTLPKGSDYGKITLPHGIVTFQPTLPKGSDCKNRKLVPLKQTLIQHNTQNTSKLYI